MVTPRTLPAVKTVAHHYDELDEIYREVWGEHVHHGYWESGNETSEEAVKKLIHFVAEVSGIKKGDSVCDIGAGYGGTARLLAGEYEAKVTAFTVSRAQYQYAIHHSPPENPTYRLCDWTQNDLPAESFDVALSIESSEHMPDQKKFFSEAARVLKPGGHFTICAWLVSDSFRKWEHRYLLEPICREGQLFSMGTRLEYQTAMEEAGFVVSAYSDLSQNVSRTWPVCLGRVAQRLVTEPKYRRFILDASKSNRIFAKTMVRIWTAYKLGCMRYGVITGVKAH